MPALALDKPNVVHKLSAKTLEIYFPEGWKASDSRPVAVAFKKTGNSYWHRHTENYLARGMVVVLAYSFNQKEKLSSNMSEIIGYIRSESRKLGIDTDKVIAQTGNPHSIPLISLVTCHAASTPAKNMPNAVIIFSPGFVKYRKNLKCDIAASITDKTPQTFLIYGGQEVAEIKFGKTLVNAYKKAGVAFGSHVFPDQERHFFSKDEWPDSTIHRAFEFLENQNFFTKVTDTEKPQSISR
jgi:hypothetical protein